MIRAMLTAVAVAVGVSGFGVVSAEDKPAAKEVKLTGTLVCGKCGLKEAKTCTNVLQVKEDGKTVNYWLVDKEFIYPLKVGVNTLGRSADNDVVVEDFHVSRRHCAILVHAGRACELHDTASKNGTYLNGTRLAGPTSLKSGDEIRICDRQFVFLAKPGSASPAATPTLLE